MEARTGAERVEIREVWLVVAVVWVILVWVSEGCIFGEVDGLTWTGRGCSGA